MLQSSVRPDRHRSLARSRACAFVLGVAFVALAWMRQRGTDEQGKTNATPAGSELPSDFDPKVLRRGNGPEPDTLDPQLARTEGAFHILRDVFEGPRRSARTARRCPARPWGGPSRPMAWSIASRCAKDCAGRMAMRSRRRGLHRRHAPSGGSETASPYAQMLDPVVNAAAITRGKSSPIRSASGRRMSTVVVRLATPAPYLLGLVAQPPTFPVHGPSLAANGTEYARPGKLVSNGAFTLADWVIGSHVVLRRDPNYWNDAATRLEEVRYVHIADAGPAASGPGEPDRLHLRRAGAAVRVDQAEPAGRVAGCAAAERLFLRLQPHAPAVQGQSQAAPRAVDGDRPRPADLRGDRRGRGARLWLGAARGLELHAAAVRLREHAVCRTAGGGTPTLPGSGVFGGQAAAGRAALQRGRSAQPSGGRGRCHVEGSPGVETTLYAEEFRALLQSIQARKETQVFRSSWVGDFNDAYTFAQLLESRSA